nr:MAG TPA: protein of unknown function (DUF5361) [Caudoviricetes sp.]
MIATDEDALICDLAETYSIYDYRRLPLKMVAVFSFGLKDDSRIKMKLNGMEVPFETMLLASAVDRLSTLVWQQTKDGMDGKNYPLSIVAMITNAQTNKENSNVTSFATGEDFMKERERLLKKGG